MTGFNDRLRQIILLALIIFIGVLMIKHFYIFLPGVLGAITIYVKPELFFTLVENRK